MSPIVKLSPATYCLPSSALSNVVHTFSTRGTHSASSSSEGQPGRFSAGTPGGNGVAAIGPSRTLPKNSCRHKEAGEQRRSMWHNYQLYVVCGCGAWGGEHTASDASGGRSAERFNDLQDFELARLLSLHIPSTSKRRRGLPDWLPRARYHRW